MAIGLYLHIPFCASKCPYCDFYSTVATPTAWDTYTAALCDAVTAWADATRETADTLYLGGGTPSLLGGERLSRIVTTARRAFHIPATAEITLEANPADDLADTLAAFAEAGGNRVSFGMQAVNDAHLAPLGRRPRAADPAAAERAAQAAGDASQALGMRQGTPAQTADDVRDAVRRCAAWGAQHVSAYLLKIEPNTPFAAAPPVLPDEDATVALYHAAADALEAHGYRHYEISNFAKHGCESRHNTKYWNGDPYLGIGPSAHSFYGGRRFAYPRSLPDFLTGVDPQPEATEESAIPENSPAEYVMLRLRLADGVRFADYAARFGQPFPDAWRRRAKALPASLICCDEQGMHLTREGFLVSNAILGQVLT